MQKINFSTNTEVRKNAYSWIFSSLLFIGLNTIFAYLALYPARSLFFSHDDYGLSVLITLPIASVLSGVIFGIVSRLCKISFKAFIVATWIGIILSTLVMFIVLPTHDLFVYGSVWRWDPADLELFIPAFLLAGALAVASFSVVKNFTK